MAFQSQNTKSVAAQSALNQRSLIKIKTLPFYRRVSQVNNCDRGYATLQLMASELVREAVRRFIEGRDTANPIKMFDRRVLSSLLSLSRVSLQ